MALRIGIPGLTLVAMFVFLSAMRFYPRGKNRVEEVYRRLEEIHRENMKVLARLGRTAAVPGAGGMILFSLCISGSFFVFFFFGLLLMGLLMRTLFWMLEGGILTFVSQMFSS